MCADANGNIAFNESFVNEVKELGFDAAGAYSPSGGALPKQVLDNRQMNQLNNNGGAVNSASKDAAASGAGQAAGGGGSGAGAAASGNSSLSQSADQSDTFDGFNNFDGSDTSPNKSNSLEISPALGKAISEQGSRAAVPVSAKFNGGNPASNSPIAASYGGGSASAFGRGSISTLSPGIDKAAAEDNSIVEQAANFFKGAFGIGSSGGASQGRGYVDNGAGQVRFKKLAASKIQSPEQVLKDKWRRMNMSGVAQRGLASSPRGMLDMRTNIFHGMCNLYSQFALEIGENDAGYCPPAN